MGATHDKVLVLVADWDSVYGIWGEGTAGISFILCKRQSEQHKPNWTTVLTMMVSKIS